MRHADGIGRVGWLAAVALAAASCDDSLVDHRAGDEVLHPSPCDVGQVTCGGVCVTEDAAHCGPACTSCPAPPDPNAESVCTEAHACASECRPGWLRVGDACQRAVAVAAGFAHTCAITAAGTVKCWGANEHGQLGDGTETDSAIPVDVALPATATAIAAGYVHTCAVAGGAAYCWGDNTTGSVGDGTTTRRTRPVAAVGMSDAKALTAGGGANLGAVTTYYGHSCALSAGSILCWGSNESGQLGDGTFEQRTTPGPVALGSLAGQVSAVAAGDRHTCAVIAGGVWCWGAAGSWQLGNGGTSNQSRPVQAQGLQSGAAGVGAGAAHSCAVISSPATALECWGSNSAGQAAAGDNSSLTVERPALVDLGAGQPAAVVAGNAHTCTQDGMTGAVTCFGANDVSQLSGVASPRGLVPVALQQAALALAAGYDHACALLADGGIQCWGANGRGQLGIGAPSASSQAPAYVSGR